MDGGFKQQLNQEYYTYWSLIKLFWRSEHRRYAYGMTVFVVILTLCLVALDAAFSFWFNYFYDALQAYDKMKTIVLLAAFMGLAAVYIIIAVYRYYFSQLFGLKWRQWMTEQLINRWLMKRDYYYLESFDPGTDNPDQRIQEDIASMVSLTMSLFVGFVGAIPTFIVFTWILWGLSGDFHLHLGPLGTYHIPGFLVWISIIYSIIGTYITFKVGKPLVNLNYQQQMREADFRFASIDLRTHAEQVALMRGELHQASILNRLMNLVLGNWYAIIVRQKIILWFTLGFNQIAVILPFIVALPNYFEKVFKLGGLMQSIRAFNSIQESTAFFVNSFTSIAEWRAVMKRLIHFINHLQSIDESVKEHTQIQFNSPSNVLALKEVGVRLPDQKILLNDVNYTFHPGEDYLLQGASGLGKSTLFRVIAGIWPYASGEVQLPKNQSMMFLPQTPYFPIGTLAEAILFPNGSTEEAKKTLPDLLQRCGLEQWIPRLDEVGRWSKQLSPGEQQRIALVRVLYHQPDWVFLDESTSMLDVTNETNFYRLIKEVLPHTTLVSIGHRPTLAAYHQTVVDVNEFKANANAYA